MPVPFKSLARFITSTFVWRLTNLSMTVRLLFDIYFPRRWATSTSVIPSLRPRFWLSMFTDCSATSIDDCWSVSFGRPDILMLFLLPYCSRSFRLETWLNSASHCFSLMVSISLFWSLICFLRHLSHFCVRKRCLPWFQVFLVHFQEFFLLFHPVFPWLYFLLRRCHF